MSKEQDQNSLDSLVNQFNLLTPEEIENTYLKVQEHFAQMTSLIDGGHDRDVDTIHLLDLKQQALLRVAKERGIDLRFCDTLVSNWRETRGI